MAKKKNSPKSKGKNKANTGTKNKKEKKSANLDEEIQKQISEEGEKEPLTDEEIKAETTKKKETKNKNEEKKLEPKKKAEPKPKTTEKKEKTSSEVEPPKLDGGPKTKTKDGGANCRQKFGQNGGVATLGTYSDETGNDWTIYTDVDNRVQVIGTVMRSKKPKALRRTANPGDAFVRWETNDKGQIIRVDLRRPRGAPKDAEKQEKKVVVFDGR